MKRSHTSMARFFNLALLTLLFVGFSACSSDISGPESTAGPDLIAIASGPSFTTLSQALEAAQLTETLRTDGPFTVFTPTDEAFAKLPKSAIETLLMPENRQVLAEILTFHVVSGRVYSSEVLQLASAKSIEGSDLTFAKEGDEILVNGARIVNTDIEASNGIIHVVDTVLLPEWFEGWISQNDLGDDPTEY